MRTAVIVLFTFFSVGQAADPAKKAEPKNALANEVSPYLRQHASNPVQWYPWGPEALARAKKENKLIFLSIGYSSCHWCHVMERESFSNSDIAKTLNANFVCIKVDREERPDIDEVYLSALQATGERGGWPLTMFLTHEAKPIFGGTYFPPDDRVVEGETIPGFKSILKRVLELVDKDRKGLYDQADRVAELTRETLDKNFRVVPLITMDRDLVTDAAIAFEFDPHWGGFGRKANGFRGSKFPRAAALRFLLSQAQNPGQEGLAKNLQLTLDQIAAGGIYDHLGGGFHRYSTERTWTVPHFEKMLYDNAQLVEVYCEAYRQRPNPAYERVIRETLAFLEREMLTPEGLFCSALDADSNHVEGEFYIWTAEQLRMLGDTPLAKRFRDVYSLNQPNFEDKHFILRLSGSWPELANKYKSTEAELVRELAPLKQQLFELRSKRQRPFRDDKALTGWNGLTIGAFAKAGAILKEPTFVTRAESTAKTLIAACRDKTGRLARMSAGLPGRAPQPRGAAFLEDYAYLIHGLLNLHDATSKAEWLSEARQLADQMLKWYGDGERGGFYTSAHDAEQLFTRSKEYYDGAYPSGNGMAAYVLARLYAKTQHRPYAVESERTIKQFLSVLKSNAIATPMMALALNELLAK